MVTTLYVPRNYTGFELQQLYFFKNQIIELKNALIGIKNADTQEKKNSLLLELLPLIHAICIVTANTAPNSNREALDFLKSTLKILNFSDEDKQQYGKRTEMHVSFFLGRKFILNTGKARSYQITSEGELILDPPLNEEEEKAITELSKKFSNYIPLKVEISCN